MATTKATVRTSKEILQYSYTLRSRTPVSRWAREAFYLTRCKRLPEPIPVPRNTEEVCAVCYRPHQVTPSLCVRCRFRIHAECGQLNQVILLSDGQTKRGLVCKDCLGQDE